MVGGVRLPYDVVTNTGCIIIVNDNKCHMHTTISRGPYHVYTTCGVAPYGMAYALWFV
jgi:hypothetical protein